MRLLIILISLTLSINCLGQNDFEIWNKNYKQINFSEFVKSEKEYAESKKKLKNFKPVMDATPHRYRFNAKYLGDQKPIEKETLDFIKKLYKFQNNDPSKIDELYKKSFLFEIDSQKVWIPIQEALEKPFKEEVKKGENVLLYCTYFTEITKDKKQNMAFVMNEFIK